MRFPILYLLLFAQLTVSAQNPQQAALLRKAYKIGSVAQLKLFMDNWARESARLGKAHVLKPNDTLRNLFSLYNAFYKKDQETFPAYLLLSDRIKFQVIDSIPVTENTEYYYTIIPEPFALRDTLTKYYDNYTTLQPFYPRLQLKNSKPLLLTEAYHKLIEEFIDTTIENRPYGSDEVTKENAHSDDKVQFLGNFLQTTGRHWGHYFDYLSFPDINEVVFDRSLHNAILWYDMSCKSGIALYQKKNGVWEEVYRRIILSQ